MNPYRDMNAGILAVILLWMFAIVAVTCTAAVIPRRVLPTAIGSGSEKYCAAFSLTLCVMQIAVAAVFLIGIVALVELRIQTILWYLWVPLYLISIGLSFCVWPVLTLAALAWSIIGRRARDYSRTTLLWAALAVVVALLNAALYFVAQVSFRGSV